MRFLFLLCVFLVIQHSASAHNPNTPYRPGKDFALFFAVNDYQFDKGASRWADLTGPISDAREIAADLYNLYGFDTAVVLNPTQELIYRKITEYGKKASAADGQLFVFFSGHGHFRNGEGFFIPREGKPTADDITGTSWVSLVRLKRWITDMACPHIMLVIDACYSGTFDDRIALKVDDFDRPGEGEYAVQQFVTQTLNAKSRLYFTSGGAQRTPDPSPFAARWKAALRNRGGPDGLLTLRELQEEYLDSNLVKPAPRFGTFDGHQPGGKFLFVYQQPKTPVNNAAMARDRDDWQKAKTANTLAAYRQYERDHPSGDFIGPCRRKIGELDDEAAWQRAKDIGTEAAYRDFIQRFPNSLYVEAAEEKLLPPPGPRTTQPTSSNPHAADRYTDPLVGVMIKVNGGTFNMGCTSEQKDCSDDEKAAHPVTLSDYYIGQTEVTQAQWRAVMGSDPANLGFPGCDQCPVERVSWEDITDFLIKLNAKSNVQYRLPTEAEWEYAARGGGKSRGYQYAGSNSLDEVAWYWENSGSKTHPVKGKKANELDLYDMSGNVWEWCADWYGSDYYGKSPAKDPKGPTSGSYRVIRGGSWDVYPQYCRVAYRSGDAPGFRYDDLGFRLARAVTP